MNSQLDIRALQVEVQLPKHPLSVYRGKLNELLLGTKVEVPDLKLE